MTRKYLVPTISEVVSNSDHLGHGTTDYPAVATHFESTPEPSVTHSQSRPLCNGNIFKNIRLEIFLFLFVFSIALNDISSSSMILDKVCIAHYKYPHHICNNLANHTEIKTSVERTSANYKLVHTLIQTAPASLLSCFVGPWSDLYGRKVPLLIATFGLTLDAFGSTVSAYFLDSRVEYYCISGAFTGLFGGTVVPLAIVYSYASEMTTFDKRTMKYALLEVVVATSRPLGVVTAGWIYKFLGYPAVFLLSTCVFVVSFIWLALLMPETRGFDNKDPLKVKFRKLFTCKTFRESFIATAKRRPQQGRLQVVLLIFSTCFITIATDSTSNIGYLYVHHQFNWSTTKFSTVTAIYSFFSIMLLIVVVPLLLLYKIGDPIIGLIGATSTFLKFMGIGISWGPIGYHVANFLGLLSACASFAIRSRISKVVSEDDLGKVFCFIATADTLLPVLATVFTSQIFNAFLSTFPGMPFIVLAVFLFLPFFVFMWMTCLPVFDEDKNQKSNLEMKPETYLKIKD